MTVKGGRHWSREIYWPYYMHDKTEISTLVHFSSSVLRSTWITANANMLGVKECWVRVVKGLACMTSNRHSYPSGQNVFRYLMITLFFPKKIVYPIVAEIFMSSDGEISRCISHRYYRAYIAEQRVSNLVVGIIRCPTATQCYLPFFCIVTKLYVILIICCDT